MSAKERYTRDEPCTECGGEVMTHIDSGQRLHRPRSLCSCGFKYIPPLDEGIRLAVELLNRRGVETYESCEGGEGHACPEPVILFEGDRSEGFKALAIALQHKLPVSYLRRVWSIGDGEPTGPIWEIVFWRTMNEEDIDLSHFTI